MSDFTPDAKPRSVSADPALFARFLEILGVDAGPANLRLLKEVVAAHLVAVPFENISKLYRYRTKGSTAVPDLEDHLDGIERWRFGGTCYANNLHLFTLLEYLGFMVSLCGADMNEPDVHLVSMVTVEGRDFIVDAGYGAPFFQPLPRDLDRDHVIDFGRCRYVLHPRDEEGRSKLEMFRDGVPIHGYLAKPEPRSSAHFGPVIADSFGPGAAFMNTVVIERFTPDRGSIRIHNLKLTETPPDGRPTTSEFADLEELIDAIEDRFNIPVDIVRTAVAGINLDADIYS